jgi:cobalamin biosynthesis Mg chelatase CobN
VRPESGQASLDDRIAASTVEERVGWMASMRQAGVRSVWQQVDAAGISDPVEVAEFVLRRLYPEQSAAWFAQILAHLRAANQAGTWSGFQRPNADS